MKKSQSSFQLPALPLWEHQKKAIEVIHGYLLESRNQTSHGAALIHMPTGTGKTGVIAIASHFINQIGTVLLLCPRIALRDQLAREVKSRFFEKFGLDPSQLPKKIYVVQKEFPSVNDGDFPCSVFIMTIQKLH